MSYTETLKKNLAAYLVDENRMVIEPTVDMMQRFPMADASDGPAWLKGVAKLLGDAVELRQPFLPSGELKLAIKDRSILFNLMQERTLEDMAKDRKANQDA